MKFLTAIVLTLVTLSSFARPESKPITQAIGEQCSVIATYVAPPQGGCGENPADFGDVQISGIMSVTAGKSYYAKFTLIDSTDQVVSFYTTDVFFADRTENWTIPDNYMSLHNRTTHAARMEVINANTNVSVCTSQSLVTPTL